MKATIEKIGEDTVLVSTPTGQHFIAERDALGIRPLDNGMTDSDTGFVAHELSNA